jgi:hypothetical protein
MVFIESERSRKLERTMRVGSRSRKDSSVGTMMTMKGALAIGCLLLSSHLGAVLQVDAFQMSTVATRISLVRLDTTFLHSAGSGSKTETSPLSQRESKYRWSERLRLRDAVSDAYSVPVEELARKVSSLLSNLAKGPYLQSLGQLRAASLAVSKNSVAAASLVAESCKASCTWAAQCSAVAVAAGKNLCSEAWWASPMCACLIPVYHAIVLQQGVGMPHWWRVFPMDHLWASPDAVAVVGFFLMSNLAYFLAAAYLLAKFPPVQAVATSSSSSSSSSQNRTGRFHTMLSLRPTKHTGLGLWVAAAGTISTLFHSFQALGDYAIAEQLCYIDHGVALTGIFYFLDVLGRPSPATCGLSLVGLVTLVRTHPGYAYLHSTWHFLSAAAAIVWAIQSTSTTGQVQVVGSESGKAASVQQEP